MSLTATSVAAVAAGGAIGAVLRYLATTAFLRLAPGFPWGTLFVNVVGSCVMGVIAAFLLERASGGFHRLAPLLITGLLGGFTTFSAFSLDLVSLLEKGRTGHAIGYAFASVTLSVTALWLGLKVSRALWGSLA